MRPRRLRVPSSVALALAATAPLPSPPLSPRAAQNGATPLTKAQLTRWDGAYLAVLLALVWLFVLELIIVSKAARTVLVEKPVAFVAGCTKWCLQPVFATWSFLMSFRSLEKTA